MPGPSDPLKRLRNAWNLALNQDALVLLRYAVTAGSLERKQARGLVDRSDLSRASAEDLADRLGEHGLLRRRQGRPVTFRPTTLGEEIVQFIDENVGKPELADHFTLLLLDVEARKRVEESGLTLDEALRYAAIDVATLRVR